MDVSIVIINFNSSKYTIGCIESIYKYTKDLTFEIIVVDNNSLKDDLKSLENFLDEKPLTFIKSKTNLGFGGGNHLGYQFAKGKHLAFVNNDAELIENSLLKLHNFITKHNDIGVLGLHQIDENNKHFVYSYRQFTGLKYHVFGIKSPVKHYNCETLKEPFEVDQVSGAFMFFKTEAYEKAGGFDTNIFLFYEEMDICYRLIKKGYKTMFYPESTFIHYQGQSSSNVNMKKEFTVSYLYLIQKNYNYWYYLITRIVLLFKYGFKSIVKPKKYFSSFLIVLKGGNSLIYSIKP